MLVLSTRTATEGQQSLRLHENDRLIIRAQQRRSCKKTIGCTGHMLGVWPEQFIDARLQDLGDVQQGRKVGLGPTKHIVAVGPLGQPCPPRYLSVRQFQGVCALSEIRGQRSHDRKLVCLTSNGPCKLFTLSAR